MCCSCANIYPLLRCQANRYADSEAGPVLPVYYANAFAHPEYPVITNRRPDEVQFFQWGLIPPWCRTWRQAQSIRAKTVNARSESVFFKPSFADSAVTRRCLVPVTGFYEWHDEGGRKYPFYLTIPGVRDFALAGIWNRWTNPETGQVFPTFCILTTEANSFVAGIHNGRQRMPVILTPSNERIWLDDDSTRGELEHLFRPYDGVMDAWPVRRIPRTASVDNNIPETQRPWYYPELGVRFDSRSGPLRSTSGLWETRSREPGRSGSGRVSGV